VLGDSSLILLGLKMFGITAGASLVTSIMVYYMEDALQSGPAFAGLIGGLALLLALVASPIAGRNFDKNKDASLPLFLSGTVMGVGLALASVATVYWATISTLIVGFCQGIGTTVGFAAAREVEAGSEYESLAVGWVNSLQLYSGFVWPIIFSFIVICSSYMLAWIIAGLFTVILASCMLVCSSRVRKA